LPTRAGEFARAAQLRRYTHIQDGDLAVLVRTANPLRREGDQQQRFELATLRGVVASSRIIRGVFRLEQADASRLTGHKKLKSFDPTLVVPLFHTASESLS
jgi:hypothetical protein